MSKLLSALIAGLVAASFSVVAVADHHMGDAKKADAAKAAEAKKDDKAAAKDAKKDDKAAAKDAKKDDKAAAKDDKAAAKK